MDETPRQIRFHALDGVRGIAILLVVLNHVDGTAIRAILPKLVGDLIFASGITGVSLLFILSGFLMAYIYPNPKTVMGFIQKRYTRIFPLFLALCSATVFLRVVPNLPWEIKLGSILGFATIGHLIWVKVVKRFANEKTKHLIFLSFITLQILVGGFYLFWVGKQPAIVFNQQIPAVARESMIGLANATLTLPLGNYIPMLDGVYWSLAAEVLFYILYPIICVPIVEFMRPQKRWIKLLGIFLLLPFFGGLILIAQNILAISMLHLELCFYFPIGICLGYLIRNRRQELNKYLTIFSSHWKPLSIFFFFTLVGAKTLLFHLVQPSWDPLVHMLWAFPFAVLIAVVLDERTSISKLLSTKVLIFFGTISYSMYLSHTIILHVVESLIHPRTIESNLLSVFATLGTTTLFSILLYKLLEEPYFKREQRVEPSMFKEKKVTKSRPRLIILCILSFYLLSAFSAFQSNFNFFSSLVSLGSIQVISPKSQEKTTLLSLDKNPEAIIQFVSPENDLQIVTMHLKSESKYMVEAKEQTLIFQMKEQGSSYWTVSNSYKLEQIGDSPTHPFGFPTIHLAKNKTFIARFALTDPSSGLYLTLDLGSLQGVYPVDKRTLLTNPAEFAKFVTNKIHAIIFNRTAQQSLILFLPFASFWLILILFPLKK